MELMLVYAAVFVGGLILFERLTGAVAGRLQRSRSLNYRLGLLEGKESTLEVYKGMVRERALDYDKGGAGPLVVLRRLFAQSGMKLDVPRMAIYALAGLVGVWLALSYFGVSTFLILVVVILCSGGRASVNDNSRPGSAHKKIHWPVTRQP